VAVLDGGVEVSALRIGLRSSPSAAVPIRMTCSALKSAGIGEDSLGSQSK
jgi:hypothetical protein